MIKVTNNRIGPQSSPLETDKAAKSSGASALSKDVGAGAAKSRESVNGSAQVEVSERAQMMQKAKQLASQPDTVDEAKVARLQKLIDEGKYKVDAKSIADRLVDEHLSIPD